jgi:hypothetical protein
VKIVIERFVEAEEWNFLPDDEGLLVRQRYVTKGKDVYDVKLLFQNYAPWMKTYRIDYTASQDERLQLIEEIGEKVKHALKIDKALEERQSIGVSFPS